jgi:hypothetical protein
LGSLGAALIYIRQDLLWRLGASYHGHHILTYIHPLRIHIFNRSLVYNSPLLRLLVGIQKGLLVGK